MKKPASKETGLGGFERSRTAVHGFADRCLATRPRNHIIRGAKLLKVLKLFPNHFFQ